MEDTNDVVGKRQGHFEPGNTFYHLNDSVEMVQNFEGDDGKPAGKAVVRKIVDYPSEGLQ